MLIWVALTVIATDIGAYMVGRCFGKTKLAPSISPSKTVAGALGGLLSAGMVGVALYFLFPKTSLVPMLVWGVAISVFSQFGDLFESAWKRKVGIKDSGKMLGSHGGFLDRFDGHVAAFICVGIFQSTRDVPIYV